MAAAAILNFQVMWIWPFWRVDSAVFVFSTKFGSNICYSHWDRRTYPSEIHTMTSRKLTSGFDFWSRAHLRMAVVHLPIKFGADIFIQFGVIDIFLKLKMAAAAILVGGAMGPSAKAHSWCVLPIKVSSWSAKFSSYKDFNVLSFRLESPIHAPKFSVFGGLYPRNFWAHCLNPEKAHPCVISRFFELSCVKIHPRVWPVGWSKKKQGINKNIILLYFTHLPRSPQWMDFCQIWYRRSPRRRNQLCRIFCRSVQGYWFCWGLKFADPHRNCRSPLTLSELPFRLWFYVHVVG